MNHRSILIVEDSLGVSRALHQALTLPQGGGYDVEVCESAEAALERLQETPFHLLISDLRLPGANGLELLERAAQLRPETRRMLITAFGSPQVEERARHLADAYLPKPFRLHELIRTVQRVLDQPVTGLAPRPEAVPAPPPPDRPETVRLPHLTVLACGLDGTLTEESAVKPEAWDVLRKARSAGLSIILVTGRTWDELGTLDEKIAMCEAIVAENGAVVYFPRRDLMMRPFGQLDPALIQRIEKSGAPLKRGKAILTAPASHDEAILKALQEMGGGAAIEYNRGAAAPFISVLPIGATKGAGLQYALSELGFSPRNVVACGDAENDRSLFAVAELAAAVANAPPAIRALADVVLPQPGVAGLRSLIAQLADGRIPAHPARLHRRLLLGRRMDGTPVHLDPVTVVGNNVGIFGGSGSGKSWLAGLLAEELLKQGYQVCIVDPEGDYRALGAGPRSLLLGGPGKPLPAASDVVNFFECGSASLVLDLSLYPSWEQAAYMLELFHGLCDLRARQGRPHWFLVDEVQNFCPPGGGEIADLLLNAMRGGGFGLVGYRPSQVTPSLLEQLAHWMLTSLRLPEEIAALQPFLSKHIGGAAALLDLPTLPVGQAYLSMGDAKQPQAAGCGTGFVQFHVGARTAPHIRHLHKYLQAPLPESKRFYFHDESGYLGRCAANLWEFRQRLIDLPAASIRYHLQRGDFTRWLHDTLHDEDLAQRICRIGARLRAGEVEDDETLRQWLLALVIERYEELDKLA